MTEVSRKPAGPHRIVSVISAFLGYAPIDNVTTDVHCTNVIITDKDYCFGTLEAKTLVHNESSQVKISSAC